MGSGEDGKLCENNIVSIKTRVGIETLKTEATLRKASIFSDKGKDALKGVY